MKRKIFFLVLIFISTFVWSGMDSSAEALSLPSIQLGVDDIEEPEKVSSALQILFLLTILTQQVKIVREKNGLGKYCFNMSKAGNFRAF